MTAYVRKNLITISATFLPPGWQPFNCDTQQANPPPLQPTQVEAVLLYTNLAGSPATVTIPMTLGSDGITWTCQWDSSAAFAGTSQVQWVAYASGAVQSAAQGSFTIIANGANTF